MQVRVADLNTKGVFGVEVGGDHEIACRRRLEDARTEKAVDLDRGGDGGATADEVFAGITGIGLTPSLLRFR